jgi:hypothetical protein
MAIDDCTEGVTLEELLGRPLDLLVLVGADDEDKDDADADSDEDSDDDNEEDDDDEDSDEDEDDDDNKDKSKKDKDKSKDDKDDKVDRAEYDRIKTRRKAAEDKVDKLLVKIEELKVKSTSDDELKKDLQSTKDENARLRTQVESLSRSNAFLSDNSHEWIDPAAALKLLDDSDIEIDENGVTQGLKPALDKLAKDKPFLLKTVEKAKPKPPRSGDQPGGGRRPTKQVQEQERKKLMGQFSALRGR